MKYDLELIVSTTQVDLNLSFKDKCKCIQAMIMWHGLELNVNISGIEFARICLFVDGAACSGYILSQMIISNLCE